MADYFLRSARQERHGVGTVVVVAEKYRQEQGDPDDRSAAGCFGGKEPESANASQLCVEQRVKLQARATQPRPINMSDSELSKPELQKLPSDATLESTLRDIVRKGNLDPVTVRSVRTAAEERLGLAQGFFKNHSEWNDKSKDVIGEAYVCQVLVT